MILTMFIFRALSPGLVSFPVKTGSKHSKLRVSQTTVKCNRLKSDEISSRKFHESSYNDKSLIIRFFFAYLQSYFPFQNKTVRNIF